MRIQDPRRLGGVQLDPDEDRLGADAMTIGAAALRDLLAGSTAPLKARLLDQARLAGVGNLIADETLWRSGLDPARPAGSLSPAEIRRLHRHLVGTIGDLIERGGSHTGDLQASRTRSGLCPRDGAPLDRRTVGGRTTYSCPVHQR
jgi:formamidopyrimidine-DNA glycosylase